MAKRKPRKPVKAALNFQSDDLRTTLHRWHTHHGCGDHWLDFLEIFLMTVADIQAQLDALAAKIAAIPAAVPPVATQTDLDAISAKITSITASVPS